MSIQKRILTVEADGSQIPVRGMESKVLQGSRGVLALGKVGDVSERCYGPVVRAKTIETTDIPAGADSIRFGTYVEGKGLLVNPNDCDGISKRYETIFALKPGQVGSFMVSGIAIVKKSQLAQIASGMRIQYIGPDYNAATAADDDVFEIEVNGFKPSTPGPTPPPGPTPTGKIVISATMAHGDVSGVGEYEEGEIVTLRATPGSGYAFLSWGNGVNDNPYTFVAQENKTLTVEEMAIQETTKSVVNGVEYADVASAVAAAGAGDRVRIVKDQIADAVTVSQSVIIDGTGSTFDLSALSSAAAFTSSQPITIENMSVVDVDPTTATSSRLVTLEVSGDDPSYVKNCTIETGSGYALVKVNSGNVIVEDCDVTGTENCGRMVFEASAATASIELKNTAVDYSNVNVPSSVAENAKYKYSCVGASGGADITLDEGTVIKGCVFGVLTMSSGGNMYVKDGAVVIGGEYGSFYIDHGYAGGMGHLFVEGGIVDGHICIKDGSLQTGKKFADITGGTFTNFAVYGYNNDGNPPGTPTFVEITSGDHIKVTGGHFDADPSAWVAEGYVATFNAETNMWDVTAQA